MIAAQFTSKERDAETGLDYFGARYYSSSQGRFTSPDEWAGGIVDAYSGGQVGKPGPLPYADIDDPQTLNKYVYVRNNPLRYVDPDGHDDVEMVQFLLRHPIIAANIGESKRGSNNISTNAARFADSLGLREDSSNEGTQVNAVRHATWQATITSRFGGGIAKEV